MGETRRGVIRGFHMAQGVFPAMNAQQRQAMGGAKADLPRGFANHGWAGRHNNLRHTCVGRGKIVGKIVKLR